MTTMRDLAGWVGLVKTKVETMRAEIIRLERLAASQRADFERERERNEKMVEELLRMTTTAMQAESNKARLESELEGFRSRNWWQRLRAF